MAMITNLKHFLDESGNLPDLTQEGMDLFKFLSHIVEVATLAYDLPLTLVEDHCNAVVNGRICKSPIETWIDFDTNEIGWECLECRHEGTITEWSGTAWDRRDYVRH